MVFQNYVCWETGRVRQVLNTDAEYASRHIFLAVHSEYPLRATDPRNLAGKPFVRFRATRERRISVLYGIVLDGIRQEGRYNHRNSTLKNRRSRKYWLSGQTSRPGERTGSAPTDWSMRPPEFLQAFLSQNSPHMQVAVLGDSGSGKSHFISWMKYNLPASADRYTIAIPRTGVSLRGVLELIIGALPETEGQSYLDELNHSGSQHSSHQDLQGRLLSEIAHAIESDQVRGDSNPDLQGALIAILPNLFHDPTLRRHLRQSDGITERLVTQVLSESNNYLPAEDRREFSTADLPLSGVQTAEMALDTRNTCDFLRSSPESQELAVDIINRNLNKAIVQVLNFSGDRLIRLLQEVRRHLRTQGRELVLLVEDLARLQGLDLSLLEALVEVGNEDNGLCNLRWAAAVTSGYYTRLPNTVQTRMNYVFQMDYQTEGEDGSIGRDGIAAFAAKYLNASRAEGADLVAWADQPEDQRGDPPNRCESCPHRSVCHSAFGAHDGVGLYPFNSDSLANMLARLNDNHDRGFNPRLLVKDVMAEVLGTYGEDLKEGQFPPRLLLNQMRGARLPPVVQDRLRQQNPQQADRQLAILELWGNGDSQPTDLAEDLYTAFGTSKPQFQRTQQQRSELVVVPEQPVRVEPVPVEPVINHAEVGDPVVSAIRAWGNGESIQDRFTNLLRPLVFDSIVGHIDWDSEGLVRSYFAGSAHRIFDKSFSVGFARQMTQRVPRPVSLTIPSGDEPQELTEAAMSLEGLYLFTRHGDWEFDGGHDLLAVYANCLERWSTDVLKQIGSFRKMQGRWDVPTAAVEMLTVGAALAGKAPRKRNDDVGWLNALFTEWPTQLVDRTREWQNLYAAYARELTPLRDAVRASASGTKGGQRGQFIDPTMLIPTIRRVRRNWTLLSPPPEDAQANQSQFGGFVGLHRRIQAELASVAAVEWHEATDWAKEWHDSFGEDISGREVIGEIRELVSLALKGGIAFNATTRQSIESALSELEAAQFDESLKRSIKLLENGDSLKLFPVLGKGPGNHVSVAAERLIPAVILLLNQLETSVDNRASSSGIIESELRENQAKIDTALRQLVTGLEVMEATHGQPD